MTTAPSIGNKRGKGLVKPSGLDKGLALAMKHWKIIQML